MSVQQFKIIFQRSQIVFVLRFSITNSPYAMMLLPLGLLLTNLQGNSILAYESNIEDQKQATFNVCE